MNSFWRSCLTHFEQQLPPQQFKTWIKPLKFQAVDNLLTLTAPNRFVLQWIRDRFLAEIERLAGERFGNEIAVSLVLAEKEAALEPKVLVPVSGGVKPSTRDISRLNPDFNFGTFVTGKASDAVALPHHPGTGIRLERDDPVWHRHVSFRLRPGRAPL